MLQTRCVELCSIKRSSHLNSRNDLLQDVRSYWASVDVLLVISLLYANCVAILQPGSPNVVKMVKFGYHTSILDV